jgi:hypothetical protein
MVSYMVGIVNVCRDDVIFELLIFFSFGMLNSGFDDISAFVSTTIFCIKL